MYIVWRMPAKGECTMHTKEIKKPRCWVGVDGIWAGRQLGIGGDEGMGATSDDSYRCVGRERGGHNLCDEATEEFLAVLAMVCAFSCYLTERITRLTPQKKWRMNMIITRRLWPGSAR
jgi:hypothetical protein